MDTSIVDFDKVQNIINGINNYLSVMVNGNEFALGLIMTGIMGTLYYMVKGIPSWIHMMLDKHLTTSMTIDSANSSYFLLLKHLHDKGLSGNSRTIKISNGQWGTDEFVKSFGYGSQYFIYDKIILLITIETVSGVTGQRPIDKITIKKIGRKHDFFDKLISYLKVNDYDPNITKYYNYKDYSQYITSQPRRKLDSIFINNNTKNILINKLDTFIKKEEYYLNFGIPYQLGILLYGPPGTGKTSLVKAIADHINKDITICKNITSFTEACQNENNNIIVAEEIDTFGLGKRKKEKKQLKEEPRLINPKSNEVVEDVSYSEGDDNDNDNNYDYQQLFSDMGENYGSYMLGELLTSMDGLIGNHGRIIIMTTNKIIELDDALLRPGRIDLQLTIGFLENISFKQMLVRFFKEHERYINELFNDYQIKDGITATIVQNDILTGMNYINIIEKYRKNKRKTK